MKKSLIVTLITSLIFSACVSSISPEVEEIKLQELQTPTLAVEENAGVLARDYIVALSEGIGARAAGSREEREASQFIYSTFQSFGYSPEIQVFNISESDEITSTNIIAVHTGQSDEIIIIVAHYDSATNGNGADDNASGVAVMLEVAEMVKDIETLYTIYFIASGAEELGSIGAYYFVDQMKENEKANAIVVVNLDSLIAGDNAYVYGGAGEGSKIRDWLLDWSDKEELALQTQSGENPEYPTGTTGDWSDHVPFKKAGISYVCFEATNWLLGEMDGYTQVDQIYGDDGRIWHTAYDYLGYIDTTFPGRVDEHLHLFVLALFEICTEYLISQ